MNKLIKFFIICAITFVVGLGLCLGGVFSGGVGGINKVAEHEEWLEGSPGEMQVEDAGRMDFNSIEVTGQVEPVFIGTKYMNDNADNVFPKVVAKAIGNNMPEEGTVMICYGENVNMPEYKTENGVLKINGGPLDNGVVELKLSTQDRIPKVVVFCGDKKLDKISVSGEVCDTTLLGVSFRDADIQVNSADICMECADSHGLKIEGSNNDISLHGDFYGKTEISSEAGDVKVETSVNKADYDIAVMAEGGDIELDNGEIEIDEAPWKYEASGGPNSMKINCLNGDVEVFFGDTLY